MLLSTAYFPPVEYFALIARDFTLSPDRVFPSLVTLEAQESYVKQSYRNRCYILTSRGREMLQVPVVHEGNILISRVRADYSVPWVEKTERAIDTAYHSSAYFDYYRDELFAILDEKEEYLFDLNLSLINFFLAKTGISAKLLLTEEYSRPGTVTDDWREIIHPKRDNSILSGLGLERSYYQVFSSRFGFTPHLSVMDLLFNEGPDSLLYLKRI